MDTSKRNTVILFVLLVVLINAAGWWSSFHWNSLGFPNCPRYLGNVWIAHLPNECYMCERDCRGVRKLHEWR